MNETTLRLLRMLGDRVKDDPSFMSHALDVYCREQELDEAELARTLSTEREAIVRLALCKKPDRESPYFEEQVQQLARHTSISQPKLIELLRHAEGSVPQDVAVLSRHHRPYGYLNIARLRQLTRSVIRTLARPPVLVAAAAILLLVFGTSLLLWSALHSRGRDHFVETHNETDTREAEKESATTDGARIASDEDRRRNALSADRPLVPPSRSQDPTRNQPADQMRPSRMPGLASEPQRKAVPPVEVAAIVRLKLDQSGTLRAAGATGGVERDTIIIGRRLTRFSIELPRGSVAGVYEMSMQGAFGEKLIRNPARSNDGKSLRVTMDLRALPPNNYHLCVERRDELPDCNTVVIIKERRAPK